MPLAAEETIESIYGDFPTRQTSGGTRYIDLADDYTAYLSFANAGMLNKGNLLCFDYVMRHLPSDRPMVEIGSFCGLSANLICYYKKKHGVANTLFTCDRWQFEGAAGNVGDSELSHADYRLFVRDTFIRNVRMFSRGDVPHTIELLSDEFFQAWQARQTQTDVFGRSVNLGGQISFCYIDGDHSEAAARADFENADRFLEPGGFILFDDSADGSHWGVTRVIETVRRLSNYRVVVKNPNYLVQKVA